LQNQGTKRVLIITYYWPPSGGAGVQRWLKFAKYLPSYGIEPVILTVDPEYASYPQMDISLGNEIPEGLKVFKTKSFEPLNMISGLLGKKHVPFGGFSNVDKSSLLQKVLRFIRGNFFIPDARVGWNRHAYKKAIELISDYQIETIITTSPPHSTQLIGLKLKQKLGIRWIADLRDPWTDIYFYNDFLHTWFAKKADLKLEKKVLNNADQIITVGHWIRQQLLLKLNQQNPQKIAVITNGFDEDDFKQITLPKNKRFTITYSGTLSDHYNISSFIKACSNLKAKQHDFKLRFVGNISVNRINEMIDAGLSDNIEQINYVSHNESIEFLFSSDALLLVIPDFKGSKGILTGKLFEYLASKKPIIAIGDPEGDASRIIAECNSGKMFSYNSVEPVESYLQNLLNNFRESKIDENRSEAYLNYSRKSLTKKLIDTL
jgi:glycosyltransferase involved in cell wall biosynthesis